MATSQAKAPIAGKRPFVMRKGISRLDDLVDGMAMANVALAGAKTIYYVDENYGSDSQSGIGGWENAKATLPPALAASHADIGSGPEGWSARNVILCKGGVLESDLVLLAAKTDVIGVGSYDRRPRCGLRGKHVPTGSTADYGTRFFNFEFVPQTGTGGVLWTLDSECSGISFINCRFDSHATTEATGGILATATVDLKILGCTFSDDFSTAAISIATGAMDGLEIIGNYIQSAAVGILINAGSSASAQIPVIQGNTIHAVTLTINDAAAKCLVLENLLISEATVSIAAGVVTGKPLSAHNYFTNPTVNMIYPTEDASTA